VNERTVAVSRYEWGGVGPRVDRLRIAVEPARSKVVGHPIYHELGALDAVAEFMEHHVFAVWDNMSLLKTLQRSLTCVNVPWVPTGPAVGRRLVNELALSEESDELGDGFVSHFELYLAAMRQAGADVVPVDTFVGLLRAGWPVVPAMREAGVPEPAAEFVGHTWDVIENAPVHCQAAVFAFGRDDIASDMFDQVTALDVSVGRLSTFVDYLRRHIRVGNEEHLPMAMRLLTDLCGTDETKWAACEEAANSALTARVRLWDGIHEAILDNTY
jgi:hypothetical protein